MVNSLSICSNQFIQHLCKGFFSRIYQGAHYDPFCALGIMESILHVWAIVFLIILYKGRHSSHSQVGKTPGILGEVK